MRKGNDQMKSFSVRPGVILVGLFIFGCAEAWGANWILYNFNDLNIRYYDAETITRPSKDIVRVWVKWEYTYKGRIEIVKRLGEKYENIDFTVALEEINCSDRTKQNLSLDDYSKDGKTIFSTSGAYGWNYIVSGSPAETLYRAVCK